jgi:hypothetical protein
MEALDRPGAVPSASTVRRYELALDVSLQLYVQTKSPHTQVHRYAHADSSPVAGFDWLWSQYVEIKDVYIFQTYTSILQLQAGTTAWAQD